MNFKKREEEEERSSSSQTEIWLLYREKCYKDSEIVEFLDKAWEVLLDTGYAGIFGAYRGVHCCEDKHEVCVTFQKQLSTNNQIMMVAFDGKMDWRVDFAYKKLVEKEIESIAQRKK